MIITIDGPPGSGKSTVARILGRSLGMPIESVGMIFRKMAKDRGASLEEFGKIAENDERIDRELDERTVNLARASENIIIDGRLAGVMLSRHGVRAFKVYIDAPLDVRAGRVAGRDGITPDEAKDAITHRERSENARYIKFYGVRQGRSDVYDLAIDSNGRKPEEISARIEEEFVKWQRKSSR
jgi:predicted cytidylate kinase